VIAKVVAVAQRTQQRHGTVVLPAFAAAPWPRLAVRAGQVRVNGGRGRGSECQRHRGGNGRDQGGPSRIPWSPTFRFRHLQRIL